MFKLDNRIEQDSFLVKENNDFQIRLMDISEVFWVILIPKKSNLTESPRLRFCPGRTFETLKK